MNGSRAATGAATAALPAPRSPARPRSDRVPQADRRTDIEPPLDIRSAGDHQFVAPAPGPTRVGARKERGGLTELNGAYQGREGLPKFAGASSYARPEIM